jgi:hypothetical protein
MSGYPRQMLNRMRNFFVSGPSTWTFAREWCCTAPRRGHCYPNLSPIYSFSATMNVLRS